MNKLNKLNKLNKSQYSITGFRGCLIAIFIILSFIMVSAQLSGIVFKPDSGIEVNHKIHAGNGVGCAKCHLLNTSNTRHMDFSGHEVCTECHEEQINNESSCSICHTLPDQKTDLRKNIKLRSLVKFDHKEHFDADITCIQCHVNTESSKSVNGNDQLPEMKVCVACHKSMAIGDTSDCSSCHIKGYEKVWPSSHKPFWMSNHGKELRESDIESNCKICHTIKNNNDCLDCHRKEKPRNHTIGWRIRGHAQKAQYRRESCAVCHNQSECVKCHTAEEPFSHTGFWGSPYNRHCLNCHIEGDNYATGGVAANCTFCHSRGKITASHRSSLYPDHNKMWNCLTCHQRAGSSSGVNIRHPYPPDSASCKSCHL